MDLTEIEKTMDAEVMENPTTLPTSYVMWLTLRSKFVDELAAKDTTILDRWKEFETWSLEELTRKYGGE